MLRFDFSNLCTHCRHKLAIIYSIKNTEIAAAVVAAASSSIFIHNQLTVNKIETKQRINTYTHNGCEGMAKSKKKCTIERAYERRDGCNEIVM